MRSFGLLRKDNLKKFLKTAFWFLLVVAFALIFRTFKAHFFEFEIHALGSITKPIVLNLDFKKTPKAPFYACFDNNCKSFSRNLGEVYFVKFNKTDENFFKKELKNTVLVFSNKEDFKKIDNIFSYIGSKNYYFSNEEIQNFEAKDLKFENKTYFAYRIPLGSNYGGHLNSFSICFLSLFYNWKYFILSYFCLVLAFFIYFFQNQNKNVKFKNWPLSLFLIAFLGLILRVAQIKTFPLWIDELYCKEIALKGFYSLFSDSGNPPLFFVLEKISTSIFSKSDLGLRILPLTFGIFSIFASFFLFKKVKNEKLGLFASFLCSINVFFIYLSQEAKSSTMCAFFIFGAVYFLFSYLENFSKKNLIFYLLFSFLLANSHYYLLIFSFSNLLFLGFILFKNKKFFEFKKIFFAQVLIFLSFLPYFLNIYKVALGEDFNTWIAPFSFQNFHILINTYFYNFYGFFVFLAILFLPYFLPKIFKNTFIENKKKKFLLNYLIFSILFIFFAVVLVSIFIKPIFDRRIFMSIYSLLFMVQILLVSGILEFRNNKFKDKIIKYLYSFFVLFLFFSITFAIDERGRFTYDYLIHFIKNDKTQKGAEYFAAIEGEKRYGEAFLELKDKNINWIIINQNKKEEEFSLEKYLKNNSILYARNVAFGAFEEKNNLEIKLYETNYSNILKAISKVKEKP